MYVDQEKRQEVLIEREQGNKLYFIINPNTTSTKSNFNVLNIL
jgi:hypothetical protein